VHRAPRWTEEDLKRIKGKVSAERPPQVKSKRVAPYGVSAAPSPYKSKLEAAFANHLVLLQKAGEIDGWLYEPFTFRLAEGKRYRVDFVSWVFASESNCFITTAYECKGWHANYRDSLTHLKWAAQRFPFFSWKKVVSNGKRGFEIMDVQV